MGSQLAPLAIRRPHAPHGMDAHRLRRLVKLTVARLGAVVLEATPPTESRQFYQRRLNEPRFNRLSPLLGRHPF